MSRDWAKDNVSLGHAIVQRRGCASSRDCSRYQLRGIRDRGDCGSSRSCRGASSCTRPSETTEIPNKPKKSVAHELLFDGVSTQRNACIAQGRAGRGVEG
eukprot:188032-Pleurochrysis_carterae.AAC.2